MREVEAKFRVTADFRLPDLAGDGLTPHPADVEPERSTLRATYFDTGDLRLAREGVTLRRRTGGSDAGWHLKLPAPSSGPESRDEIQLPDAPELPESLAELVTVYRRTVPLGPVATLRTERTTWPLHGPDGEQLGELVDDTVAVLGADDSISATFRELEVEAAQGVADPIDLLHRVGAVLVAAGAVGGEFTPKVVRALGAQALAAPEPPPPDPVRPRDSARLAIEAHLRRHVRAFMTADPQVRRDQPDSVHQMRVAARRLRSGLRTFGPLLEPEWSAGLQAELRWIAGVLGEVRDTEVLLARLRRAVAALPEPLVMGDAGERLGAALTERLTVARTAAHQTLRGDRYVALVEAMVGAATAPPVTAAAQRPAERVLPPLVRRAWRKLRRRARRLTLDASDEAFHRARIAAKRARYAGELCAPVFGAPAKDFAAAVESAQDLLGEHQDAAVAAATLRELAAAADPTGAGFTFGVLYERERAAARAARESFVDVWWSVRRRRHRRWLRP